MTSVTLVDELSENKPTAVADNSASCEAQDDDGIIFPSHFVFTDQHAQAVRAVGVIAFAPARAPARNEAILYRDFMSKAVEEAGAKSNGKLSKH